MAKEKSPAFQFYPREYQGDENVKAMTHEERGMYVDLLCTCWQEGSLPSEPRRLARILSITEERLSEVWEFIGPCFERDPDNPDRLRHLRLDKEREKQREWREGKARGGRASGEARRRKAKGRKKYEHRSNTVGTENEHEPNTTERTGNSKQETGDSKQETRNYPTPEEASGGTYPDDFEATWKAYPSRPNANKKESYRCWLATVRKGNAPTKIHEGVKLYAMKCTVEKTEPRYIKQPATFFGPNEHWRTAWKPERDPRKEYDGASAAKAKEAEQRRSTETRQRETEDELAARRIDRWVLEHGEDFAAIKERLAAERNLDPEDVINRVTLNTIARSEVGRLLQSEAA